MILLLAKILEEFLFAFYLASQIYRYDQNSQNFHYIHFYIEVSNFSDQKFFALFFEEIKAERKYQSH